MAVLSDYTDGTITVTNGSADFTGTDTLWRSAAFREGDTVLLRGFTGVIAGTSDDDPLILSNTTGQFTEPWPGASGTFAYRMRYQPDNARFSAKSTALINLLANGILRGIADIGVQDGKLLIGNVAGLYDLIDKSELGLQDPNGSLGKLGALTLAASKILNTDASGGLTQSDITAAALVLLKLAGAAGADQLPYFTGASSAGLTPLTPVARSLLDDTTIAGVRATIGASRPAFKAHTATDIAVGNGNNNIPFNAVNLNIGNGWNGNVFTAPETGIYLLGCEVNIAGGNVNQGDTVLTLNVRGTWWQDTARSRLNEYFHVLSSVTVARLLAGETFNPVVRLGNWVGTVNALAGRCFVYGSLIG